MDKCCHSKKFPVFAGLILAIGVLWLLAEVGTITLDLPWLPIIVVVLALGVIAKHSHMSKK